MRAGGGADGGEEPSLALAIEVSDTGATSTLALAGELDLSTAAKLQAAIDEQVGRGRHRLVVDLAELTFCDSTGLTTFVRGNRDCTAKGGWLRLAGARGHVARVIGISGLLEVLAYQPDRDLA
jgi:anti-anti-sigma factor